MASAQRLRQLLRPALPVARQLQPAVVSSAPLSTTSALSAGPARTSPKVKAVVHGYRKTTRTIEGRKPAPGERKAFRKRIQLSNNSALPVEGTESVGAETMVDGEAEGKMFALTDELIDQLRTIEAFKSTQSWGLFRQPHFLVRPETTKLMRSLAEAADKKEAFKGIISGSRLSGKSMLLLQSMCYALLNKWVVINIPEGQDLTNAQTDYSPVPDTDPMQFTQPTYTLKLLQNLYKANQAVLEGLEIQLDATKPLVFAEGNTLADLVRGAKDSEYAWPIFSALWAELTLPGRPPILFCVDGLAHISKISEYRDPSFNLVHAHDLVLLRAFIDALSGKTTLPNGGAILAATSANNVPLLPSLQLVVAQLEAGQAGQEIPKPNPYERKYDERVYEALKDCNILRLDGVSKDEARTLMEYWGASGMMKQVLNWHLVSEKWAIGGRGIVGEMERASLETMRM